MDSLRLFLIGAFLTISLLGGFASPLDQKIGKHKDTTKITDAFVEFKALVENQLPEDYMKENYFLFNYLKKRIFNVTAAYQQMQEYLRWRSDENIADILNEDWTDMRSKFPYAIEAKDIDGRPILYAKLGDWDIAGYLKEGGDENSLVCYVVMILERVESLMRHRRSEGSNIVSYRVLINAAGFSLEKHGCEECFEVYGEMESLLQFLPSNRESPIIGNVSPTFKKNMFRFSEYLSPGTMLFGEDKDGLMQTLLTHNDMDAPTDNDLEMPAF